MAVSEIIVRRSSDGGGGNGGGNSGGGSGGSSPGGTTSPSKDNGKAPNPDPNSESGQTLGTGQKPDQEPKPQQPAGNSPFKDMQSHWASNAIQRLTEKRFMHGYPDGTFKPNQPMSRAEFMTVISRMLGLEEGQGESVFKDVPADAWYSKYVSAVHKLGIVQGYADGTLKPQQAITREEAFAILYRVG